MDAAAMKELAGAISTAGAFIGAGIAMGVGAFGPGLGNGYAAGHACEAIARRPDQVGLITRTMLIGMAVAESCGIYALVVALILVFR